MEPDSIIHPVVMSGDMGRVVQLQKERQLTAHEKYHALTKQCNPDPSYEFPSVACEKQQCSFQRTWLTKYSGLVYSENEDGVSVNIVYCLARFHTRCPTSRPHLLLCHPLTYKRPLKSCVNNIMALVVTHHVSTIYKLLKRLSLLSDGE